MAESETETKSFKANDLDREIQLIRCEDLFCRKCVRYFTTKSEFNLHLQEHLEDMSCSKTNYMNYIEKYICSNCSKSFEVKSDLIIHYNTVCVDAPYTCKHCNARCENSDFLRMHLTFYHNYSEKMLRDEGFLTDLDENPYVPKHSINESLKCFSPVSFKSSSSEVTEDFYGVDSSSLSKISCSKRKYRRTGCKRRDLAFNLLDKMHACEICNESFSRKCVLDMHARKHILEQRERKLVVRHTSAKPSTNKLRENNCSPATRMKVSDAESCEATEKHFDSSRAILKPSNVVLGSSVWKKIHPKKEFQYVKSSVSTRSAMQKSKIIDISEVQNQNSSCSKSVLKPSNVVLGSSIWKKIKLKTKLKNKASRERKPSEKSIRMKRNIKSKSVKIKRRKKKSNIGGKQKMCELCKHKFKDNYKLRRHIFIHTGERPYSCHKCKKTFSRDDHLKRHIVKVCSKTDKVNI